LYRLAFALSVRALCSIYVSLSLSLCFSPFFFGSRAGGVASSKRIELYKLESSDIDEKARESQTRPSYTEVARRRRRRWYLMMMEEEKVQGGGIKQMGFEWGRANW
jgi:hypothetical protein